MISSEVITNAKLDTINALIKRSKLHWYSEGEYTDASLKLLKIDKRWMDENEGLCILDGDEVVGFMGYSMYQDYWYLEHLWIDPSKIGYGYGCQAVELLQNLAERAGIHKISLLPEPKAEGFYKKCGARFTGLEVPSVCPNGPVFKEMMFRF